MKTVPCIAITLCLTLSGVVPAYAQSPARDLSTMSIEDLLSVEVVSASRKEQRLADVPAAVFVLTHDDIRRSGMTSVPELLRLVPGVDVAQLNANKWAVSVRGFNALYANKLLVLVDGRSIYNHLFSGVFWDTLDMPVDDIDRIEVVRGPGGAVWGANAINGVINIVTKTAADTQGAAVAIGDGTFDGERGGIRYGGTTKEGAYRVFGQWSRHQPSLAMGGGAADDPSHSTTGGFRLDGSKPAGMYTLEGGVTDNHASSLWTLATSPDPAIQQGETSVSSHNVDVNLLGRWTSIHARGATWQTQAFVDMTRRTDSNVATGRNAIDFDTQYHTKAGNHDVVTGAGYRMTTEWATQQAFGFSLDPARQTEQLVNVFAQDEIALGQRVRATVGAKVEYSNEVGVGVQPTARVLWMPAAKQRVWASISRASRTPSLVERSGVINLTPTIVNGMPMVIRYLGNPDVQVETLTTSEAGYRFEASQSLSMDVTAYYGRYDHLGSDEPFTPFVEMTQSSPRIVAGVQFANLFGAHTSGVEVAAHWTPAAQWRLDGSYTGFHATPVVNPASSDPTSAAWRGSAPGHQWQIHSSWAISPRAEVDALLLHVGPMSDSTTPAYTRADAKLSLTLTPRLVLDFIGQNLLAPSHVEMSSASFMETTRIPRAANARLTWRF